MISKYHLIKGNYGKGRALNIPYNGECLSTFDDISTLDLATMDIDFKNIDSFMKEYNQGLENRGNYYDLSYPNSKNKCKTFAPIFNYGNNLIISKYMDYLRYFAEQRNFKAQNGENLRLDENKQLEDFMYDSFRYILRNDFEKYIKYESLLSLKYKDMILEKNERYKMGMDNYINYHSGLFKSLTSSYTLLRLIILEIIRNNSSSHILNRSDLNTYKRWDFDLNAYKNPSEIKTKEKEVEYKQLTFQDLYPEIFKQNEEKKKGKRLIKLKELNL